MRIPLFVLLLTGCAAPPEAPTELAELNGFLFLHLDDEDTGELAAGAANLATFLRAIPAADLALDAGWDGRIWTPEPLGPAAWGTTTMWADADPANQLAIALAGRSAFAPDDHLALVALVDQTPIESSSSVGYDRRFDTDLDCFLDQSCDYLDTTSTIHRQNFLLDVIYDGREEFRRVEMPDDGGVALLSRFWVEQPYVGEDGQNELRQFTALETILASGDGGAINYTALWGEIGWEFDPGEEIQRNTTRNGMNEGFENKEAYLEAN